MTWLRDALAHLLHPTDPPKAEVEDKRARRQWRQIRETDRVLRAYRELDGYLELRLHHERRK